ncbi:3-oxoacyl-[acyl-carrier-protein] reductase FabG [Fusarium oxysporum f. sp. albedinis]|nr:3-oxoacyl-[acyl-carrier-protein] reductase FabG [Fusarium oxysporum f. sp. albedinis]
MTVLVLLVTPSYNGDYSVLPYLLHPSYSTNNRSFIVLQYSEHGSFLILLFFAGHLRLATKVDRATTYHTENTNPISCIMITVNLAEAESPILRHQHQALNCQVSEVF